MFQKRVRIDLMIITLVQGTLWAVTEIVQIFEYRTIYTIPFLLHEVQLQAFKMWLIQDFFGRCEDSSYPINNRLCLTLAEIPYLTVNINAQC